MERLWPMGGRSRVCARRSWRAAPCTTPLSSNPYGLRLAPTPANSWPNVAMQQADGSSAQTGGIVLVGPVASRLIANKVASYAVQADRLDRGSAGGHQGRRQVRKRHVRSVRPTGWLDTRGSLSSSPVSCPCQHHPATPVTHVLVEQLGSRPGRSSTRPGSACRLAVLDPKHLMNELLVYGTGTPSAHTDVAFNRAVPVGRQMLSATTEVSVLPGGPRQPGRSGPDRVLTVNGVPVFVASS